MPLAREWPWAENHASPLSDVLCSSRDTLAAALRWDRGNATTADLADMLDDGTLDPYQIPEPVRGSQRQELLTQALRAARRAWDAAICADDDPGAAILAALDPFLDIEVAEVLLDA